MTNRFDWEGPRERSGLDLMAKVMENLAKQDDYRQAHGIDVPVGECEAGIHKTSDPEGVCHHCRRLGWRPGDVNR